MTDPFNLTIHGEYLQAFIKVFSQTSGEPFFFFIVLMMLFILTYLVTNNFGIATMIFFIISGSLLFSHLTTFTAEKNLLIPSEFQSWIYILIVVGGVAAYFWFALRK